MAHGISSMVDEKTVLIGSAHFVFEDEGCRVPEGEEDKFESLPPEYSHLYLCIAGELAAVICIHDPLRKEAKAAVRALHELGIDKVVMMTGDSRKTAEAVAAELGPGESVEVQVGDTPIVIRRKLHIAEPMTIDEALYEMELIGHDFFLFVNKETGRPSVVYHRHGWSYGVFEIDTPENVAK